MTLVLIQNPLGWLHSQTFLKNSASFTFFWCCILSTSLLIIDPLSTPASQSLHVRTPSSQNERYWSHVSLGPNFLERPASEPNIRGSGGTLQGYMEDDSMSTQQLGSTKQPEPEPLHPLALSYGVEPSYEPISSHVPEMPHPRSMLSPSPGAGTVTGNRSGSTLTVLEPTRTVKPTRIFGRGTSSDSPNPGETPVVVLRVQVLSCQDLEAKDSNGKSDPYVVVSLMGKQSKTPVCKRNLNPVYEAKEATFDFPIYMSLVNKLSTLEFAVWDKDLIGKDFLGNYALPIDQWFNGTAFAFNVPDNQDFAVDLKSSPHGSMRIKIGFVPLNSTSQPDFEKIYNALKSAVQVRGPSVTDRNHVGTVIVDIICAKDLPKWPNMTGTGFDMDPFVQVSIGERAQSTTVILHERNPVWDERLTFRVSKHDLSQAIRIAVFDRDKITRNDYVGGAEISIATLIERAATKGRHAELSPDELATIDDFELPLNLTKRSGRVNETVPTIILILRVNFQWDVAIRN
ncbi:C2 domain-containing protein [Lactarius hatsudake]|nr:C2 domain-containing protein [Lactarius hatsudake]